MMDQIQQAHEDEIQALIACHKEEIKKMNDQQCQLVAVNSQLKTDLGAANEHALNLQAEITTLKNKLQDAQDPQIYNDLLKKAEIVGMSEVLKLATGWVDRQHRHIGDSWAISCSGNASRWRRATPTWVAPAPVEGGAQVRALARCREQAQPFGESFLRSYHSQAFAESFTDQDNSL